MGLLLFSYSYNTICLCVVLTLAVCCPRVSLLHSDIARRLVCLRACLTLPSQVALAGIAADLGVDLEALHFADVAFHQGSEFSIEKEFRGESGLCFDLRVRLVPVSCRASGRHS